LTSLDKRDLTPQSPLRARGKSLKFMKDLKGDRLNGRVEIE